MVNSVLRPLRRWPAVDAVMARIAGLFTTWAEDGLQESDGEPAWPPAPTSVAPATFEMRFMRLHAGGRFDEMWEMLAEDAQRAWGDRASFIREMPRLGDDTELLDIEVLDVKVLESWTDRQHERIYSNVAQMMLRYRVRQQWKDWTLDRQVHLIPAVGGWRTLCYPAYVKSTSQTR